ncbi:MAG: hypothetical protein GC160_23295 [Acidobacteria bacterium]|nr:hypothetical protein [Acidobacteriota bacterium]
MFVPPKGLGVLSDPQRPEGYLLARVWDGEAKGFAYPEQAAGLTPRKGATGVCFCGGGNRAMVAAWGQLRALVEAGWLDRVDYISSVSGGSWAATAFTYYSEGAANDEQFLGRTTPPEKLRAATLQQISPVSLGATATESFMSRLVEQALFVSMRQISPNEVWQRAVGATFFERFGLYDRGQAEYLSYNDETVADILRRNPGLQGARFHTVRRKAGDAKRPYLIVNSTLMWPDAGNLVPFEYTPLASGSKRRLTLEDGGGRRQTVGGGFLESFAFGSGAPQQWPPEEGTACASWAGSVGCVSVPPPRRPFSPAFASGTSSAAFAATNASLLGGNALLNNYLRQGPPVERYWPIEPLDRSTPPSAEDYTFGDGGSLENYGLIPLLLRGVERAVVFINTERRLNVDYSPGEPPYRQPSITELDGNFGPLFGLLPSDRNQPPTPNNQVFRTEDLSRVLRALREAQADGGPMLATTRLQVQDNAWWGLTGGWDVDVCWYYLDRAPAWEARLDPEVRRLIEAGNRAAPDEKIPYWGFPNYKTMFQGGKLAIIAMSAGEANLLADLCAWAATQSPRSRQIAEILGAA